jgi:glutamate racemase
VYLGDTARLPYGTKSPATVSRYALQAARALVAENVKLLTVACNTASALALEELRRELPDLPVIGVVEPGAQAACRVSRTGRIAVIATEATASHGAYERAIRAIRPDAKVVSRGCSLFVALAEEGWTKGAIAEAVAREYLEPIFAQDGAPGRDRDALSMARAPRGEGTRVGTERRQAATSTLQNVDETAGEMPDCLVLGCTHFPALLETIRKVIGPGVHVVDSAETASGRVREELDARGLRAPSGSTADVRLLATDAPERFLRNAERFFPGELLPERIELVDL